MATGGPNNYHGKDMKGAHHGRGIGNKEFDLVAGHVVSTMKELGVSDELISEVAGLLLPLRPDCTDADEIEKTVSLFERLGGETAITAVAEGMYAKIFTDPELIDFFRKTDKPH